MHMHMHMHIRVRVRKHQQQQQLSPFVTPNVTPNVNQLYSKVDNKKAKVAMSIWMPTTPAADLRAGTKLSNVFNGRIVTRVVRENGSGEKKYVMMHKCYCH